MRLRAVAALLYGVFLLSACGASGGNHGADAATDAAASLSFTGDTLDGSSFDGTQLAGKPTVLWFWAPWCPTCRAQAPAVRSLAEKYDGDVNVLGVGGLGDVDDIRDFARQVDGPVHLVDPDGAIWRHFG